MSETIKILAGKPAIVAVMNAMCEVLGPDSDIIKHFGIPADGDLSEVQVEVKVNGIVVPFVECLQPAMDRILASIDKEVEDKAIELLKSSPTLSNLYNEIENAEWKIREALEAVTKEGS